MSFTVTRRDGIPDSDSSAPSEVSHLFVDAGDWLAEVSAEVFPEET